MADPNEWLEVTLDANIRHGLAEAVEQTAKSDNDALLLALARPALSDGG